MEEASQNDNPQGKGRISDTGTVRPWNMQQTARALRMKAAEKAGMDCLTKMSVYLATTQIAGQCDSALK